MKISKVALVSPFVFACGTREGSMKSRQFQIVSTLALVMASTVAFIAVSRPLAAQPIPNIYNIGNRFADKCLQPVDGSTTAGAAIVLKPCDNTAAQQWKSVAVKFPYVHYVNQLSGMCLDARGGATNRTPVQQWPCNNITNENWVPESPKRTIMNPNGISSLISGVAGSYPAFCLDIPGGQTAAGVAVQIYSCNGTAAQNWFVPGSIFP